MKLWTALLAVPLLVALNGNPAQAGPYAGEVFTATGIEATTSGNLFDARFTIGNQVGTTSLWTVTSFDATAVGCAANCTGNWTLNALLYNSTTNSLVGGALSPIYVAGGDKMTLSLTFLDGNTANNGYVMADLTNLQKSKKGWFSDPVKRVPEPSPLLLLGAGLLAVGVWRRLSNAQK
jgi:hypothetical protein